MKLVCASLQGEPVLHRVHCSLNINTETGRLSARRPNLQNQPALEKDRYKVISPPHPPPLNTSFHFLVAPTEQKKCTAPQSHL